MRVVKEIIKTYENHPSIKLIKDNVLSEHEDFTIEPATVEGMNKLIKHLTQRKPLDLIRFRLSKIVKVAANIIDSDLTNIINNDLPMNSSSNSAKVGSVRPIFKKDNRTNIKNHRPVSLFNCFSKVYEKFLNEQLLHFMNHSLSDFMSAYRKGTVPVIF